MMGLVDRQGSMTKTVVQILKQFLDKVLAVQFVGALVRKGKGVQVLIDTALHHVMKGIQNKLIIINN